MKSTIPCHNTLLDSGSSWRSLAFQALQTHRSSRCLHSPPVLSPLCLCIPNFPLHFLCYTPSHWTLHACPFSSVQLIVTLHCRPPDSSVHGVSRQEYWSGFSCPIPGDLPKPGIKPKSLASPALAHRFSTSSTTWDPVIGLWVTRNLESSYLQIPNFMTFAKTLFSNKITVTVTGRLGLSIDSLEKTLMLGKIEGRRRRRRQRVRWFDDITNSMDMSLSNGEGQGSLACYSPRDHKDSHMTKQLNNNKVLGGSFGAGGALFNSLHRKYGNVGSHSLFCHILKMREEEQTEQRHVLRMTPQASFVTDGVQQNPSQHHLKHTDLHWAHLSFPFSFPSTT